MVKSKNWTEDQQQYQNKCLKCGSLFLGLKYRRVCRKCTFPDYSKPLDSGKPLDGCKGMAAGFIIGMVFWLTIILLAL